MGRRRRPYAPGAFFHLVSRLHHRRPLFTPPIRSQIVRLIHASVAYTDARLVAYAVMPNHLHVIVRQGTSELAAVMQPLLRRVAHRVQKQHGIEGTVVERRYRDRLCANAEHLRHALVYTHLNPWRAGLCGEDLKYPWSSQAAYLPDADPAEYGIDPGLQERVLHLFAAEPRANRPDLCRDYKGWVEWQMRRDAALRQSAESLTDESLANRPPTWAGDDVWLRYLADYDRGPPHGDRSLPDLRDYIHIELARIAPLITPRQLQGSWLPRPLGRVRARLIRSAAERGYRTGLIARFFGISAQSVSRIKHSRDRERGGTEECAFGPIR